MVDGMGWVPWLRRDCAYVRVHCFGAFCWPGCGCICGVGGRYEEILVAMLR